MKIAQTIAAESKCISKQVGALIVKDDRILATGINGTPHGLPNCCDVAEEMGFGLRNQDKFKIEVLDRAKHSAWSDSNEIHAELNAIIFAARKGLAIDGSVMYVTHSPCPQCCKAIAQSGIKKIVFGEEYDRSPKGWADILTQAGIEVFKI